MKSILLVDDEPQVLRAIQHVLQSMSTEARVQATSNGREALALMRDQHFDLIVTDIFMPEMDGLETIGAVRKNLLGTKILALSGGGSLGNTEFLRMAELMGADATMAKPFDPEALADRVRALLQLPKGAARSSRSR